MCRLDGNQFYWFTGGGSLGGGAPTYMCAHMTVKCWRITSRHTLMVNTPLPEI